eukprot:gene24159-9746_t
MLVHEEMIYQVPFSSVLPPALQPDPQGGSKPVQYTCVSGQLAAAGSAGPTGECTPPSSRHSSFASSKHDRTKKVAMTHVLLVCNGSSIAAFSYSLRSLDFAAVVRDEDTEALDQFDAETSMRGEHLSNLLDSSGQLADFDHRARTSCNVLPSASSLTARLSKQLSQRSSIIMLGLPPSLVPSKGARRAIKASEKVSSWPVVWGSLLDPLPCPHPNQSPWVPALLMPKGKASRASPSRTSWGSRAGLRPSKSLKNLAKSQASGQHPSPPMTPDKGLQHRGVSALARPILRPFTSLPPLSVQAVESSTGTSPLSTPASYAPSLSPASSHISSQLSTPSGTWRIPSHSTVHSSNISALQPPTNGSSHASSNSASHTPPHASVHTPTKAVMSLSPFFRNRSCLSPAASAAAPPPPVAHRSRLEVSSSSKASTSFSDTHAGRASVPDPAHRIRDGGESERAGSVRGSIEGIASLREGATPREPGVRFEEAETKLEPAVTSYCIEANSALQLHLASIELLSGHTGLALAHYSQSNVWGFLPSLLLQQPLVALELLKAFASFITHNHIPTARPSTTTGAGAGMGAGAAAVSLEPATNSSIEKLGQMGFNRRRKLLENKWKESMSLVLGPFLPLEYQANAKLTGSADPVATLAGVHAAAGFGVPLLGLPQL